MMKKNLSFLIALALSLTVNTAVFADAANSAVPSNTNVINTSSDNMTITLDDAINNLEKNNTELKLMNDKVNALYKQYDIDHNMATSTDTSLLEANIQLFKSNLNNNIFRLQFDILQNKYLGAKLVQEVIPLSDELNIKKAKNDRDERLNVIKFDLQRQYMNVLNSREQIDNINKTIANIDEKIRQTEEKIKVGQAASNALDSLNVQKTQLEAQKDDIQDSIEQSLLKIKQYLNIGLGKTLNLTPVKKDFIVFDDKDILNKINDSVNKDYSLVLLNGKIDLLKRTEDIYSKYSHNYFSDTRNLAQQTGANYIASEANAKSQLAGAQTDLISAKAGLPQALLANYYALKNKEGSVQTQILTEKTAQDTYDKLKKNFEVGMIDKVTLDSAALELDKQKNLTERAVNEYMVAQDEFNYMLQGHASGYPNMSKQSMGTPGIGY
ncbi:TolC family protein [Clostridium aciditolerans]|uniref:TolC family protein n=1 Tax=Clostridium aciditolerans TaxID=339861 RepID=A0A934HUL9_9CLOT|nr:TolC family protein [Clostridium aciditolerans]MBI6873618.1 TolC family protein [Clostridium aciditolerans]